MAEQDTKKANEAIFIEDVAKAQDTVKELATHKGVTVLNIGSHQCRPCNAFAPSFKAVAKGRQESFVALKLPTFEEAGEVVGTVKEQLGFEVASYPTTVVLKDGKPIGEPIMGNIPPGVFDIMLSAKLDKASVIQTKIAALDANKDGVVNVNEIKKVVPHHYQNNALARVLVDEVVKATNTKTEKLTVIDEDRIVGQFVKDRLTFVQRAAVSPTDDSVTVLSLSNGISLEDLGQMASSLLPANNPAPKAVKGGGR